jgi:hypothetical protein
VNSQKSKVESLKQKFSNHKPKASKLEKDTDVTNSIMHQNYYLSSLKWNIYTDNQSDNIYFVPDLIFIKLIVLKLPEKNYFCGVKF